VCRHFIDATTYGNSLMLIFNLIGIPALVYFLWVVSQVHNDSVMDWNRRPWSAPRPRQRAVHHGAEGVCKH
jgi:hypothetical protein